MARNYKQEYQKFQSSPKAIKNRTKLNKINRNKGTYGNGDGLDVSHMKGGSVKLEPQSKNRGNGTRTPGDRRARGKKPFTANLGYNLNKRMFQDGGGIEVELPSVEVDMPEVNMPEVEVSAPEVEVSGPMTEAESMEMSVDESGPVSFNDDSPEGPINEEDVVMERDETFLPPDEDISAKGDSLAKDTMKFMGKTGMKKKVIQPMVGAGLAKVGAKGMSRAIPGVGYGLLAYDAMPLMMEGYAKGHTEAFGPTLDAHEAEFGKESRDKLEATTHSYGVSGPGSGYGAKMKRGGKVPGYRVGGKIRY